MTQPITGGVISIEDGTKPAEDYAPARKVRVELRFDVTDDKNPINVIDYASDLARAQVNKLLGRPTTAKDTALQQGPLSDDPELHPAALALVENPGQRSDNSPPEGVKRIRRTAAQIAADKAAAEGAGEPAQSAEADSNIPVSATDAAPASPESGASSPTTSSEPSGAGSGLDFSEFDVPAATTVTDAELNAACAKKNAMLNDPVKIRNLIGTFNPDPSKPFQVREIPNEQRADFIAKLEALS
jgi:hypothetical protein